jgi:hypothetical protein
MVGMLALLAGDHGASPGRIKPKTMQLVFDDSPLARSNKKKAKTSLGIRIMSPSGATCMHTDRCFNDLTLYKSNKSDIIEMYFFSS